MTENLLREALQRQADRAADPDLVRAALPRRAARRTRRRYGSMIGGLVVAGALTAFAVPVLALDDAPAPRGAGPAASATGSAPAGSEVPAAVGLRYKPTWLPSGLTERARTVPLKSDYGYDGPVRYWKRTGTDPGFYTGGDRLEFGVITAKNGVDQFGDDGEAVDINGKQGRYSGGSGDDKSSLHWMIDAQTVIFIHNVETGVSAADLLKIARSVQPDRDQVPVPLRFGTLPAGMAPVAAQFSGDSAERWQLEITASGPVPGASESPDPEKDKPTQGSTRGMYVHLGQTTDAPDGGETTSVGGRPARIVIRPMEGPAAALGDHAWVVVELASGLKLTVFGSIPAVTRDEILAAAATVEVGAVPDFSWLGAPSR